MNVGDPLAQPERLIRRVYSYAAFRLGDGPDAEDATSQAFENALRYRSSYDPAKGTPAAWLLGIARRCVDETLERGRRDGDELDAELAAPGELEPGLIRDLDVRRAVLQLDERARQLIALRYGADLTARQIAALLGQRTNTVEVALHRALGRLRAELQDERPPAVRDSPALVL